LYHSSAILLPDGSVFIAGSNPNPDVETDHIYPTEYRTEKFYPWYYNLARPQPTDLPSQLGYGGNYFNVGLSGASLLGLSKGVAVTRARAVIIRPGFSTHGVNMGQRYLQLNSTASANSDNSITMYISQVPPNPALFPPGSALLYIVVDDVPSVGKQVMVGNGIGTQAKNPAQRLPGP